MGEFIDGLGAAVMVLAIFSVTIFVGIVSIGMAIAFLHWVGVSP